MKKCIFSILFVALMSINLSAQVITRKTSIENINEVSRFVDKVKIDVKTMPKIDIDKLLLEDEEDKKANVPFRFGSAFNVNYNLENSGTWIDIGTGRVWALEIKCQNAYSINLAFDNFYLPSKSKLYIYNI